MILPPAHVEDSAGSWTVRRAWPSSTGCDLEVVSRSEGRIRAGLWRDGQAQIASADHDRHLPGLARAVAEGTIVSWRRGRRVVVQAHNGSGYLKVVRGDAVASVVASHARADSFRTGFRTPDVTVRDPDGCVHLSRVPGRTLHDLGADEAVADATVARAWSAWARGWAEVLATAPAADAACHTHVEETAVLLRWRDLALRAGVDAHVAAAFDTAAARLSHSPGDASVVAHRDLHDKQVLWDGTGSGLIDLDTAARAEPALDLANLRAHVSWRHAQGRLTAARAYRAREAVDAVADRAGVDPQRMAAYEASTRLRLGALYLFRPAGRSLATRWLAREAAQTSR